MEWTEYWALPEPFIFAEKHQFNEIFFMTRLLTKKEEKIWCATYFIFFFLKSQG